MMSRIFGENLKKKSNDAFWVIALFEFCTLQICNCDISESIIGRGSKLLSACRVENLKKKSYDFFLNKCCLNIVLFSLIFCNCYLIA